MRRSQPCPKCKLTVSQTPIETDGRLYMTCPYCGRRWMIERTKETTK